MSLDLDFTGIAEELELRFARGVAEPWPDQDFDALALSAFRLQYEAEPAFRAFCDGRGRTPATVGRWQDVPAVPARAFKHIELAVGDVEVVFETSGTTRGPELRGRHLVPRASLYRASLLPPFHRHVLAATGAGSARSDRMPFVSLIPPPSAMPRSSLSFMVGSAAEAFSAETHWVVDASGALDQSRLRAAVAEASSDERPVLVLGTALALLHMLDRLETEPVPPLPEGSRVMETGGFKGLDREVGRDELYGRLEIALGLPRGRIVSEYGMTELLSQLYDPVLSEPSAAGVHVPPPWLKVRSLDPVTLEELESGQPGLLAFFDLANAGSTCHVLTEDVGTVVDGRVRLQGRVRGAEPRGCSRAMDELMASTGGTK
jgi:hypothetical protein